MDLFLRTGAYVFVWFKQLGGFNPPVAQTKGPVERKSSSHFQLDPSFFGTVRAFSRIFHTFMANSARCILELKVDTSVIIEQCFSVVAVRRSDGESQVVQGSKEQVVGR